VASAAAEGLRKVQPEMRATRATPAARPSGQREKKMKNEDASSGRRKNDRRQRGTPNIAATHGLISPPRRIRRVMGPQLSSRTPRSARARNPSGRELATTYEATQQGRQCSSLHIPTKSFQQKPKIHDREVLAKFIYRKFRIALCAPLTLLYRTIYKRGFALDSVLPAQQFLGGFRLHLKDYFPGRPICSSIMLGHRHPVIIPRSRKLSADLLEINARVVDPDKRQRRNSTGHELLSNELLHSSGVMTESVQQREEASRSIV